MTTVVSWAILGGMAAGMGLFTAAVLRWGAESRTRTRVWFVIFLMATMSEMLAGALWYSWHPSGASAAAALWFTGLSMPATLCPLLVVVASEARRSPRAGVTAGDAVADPRSGWFVGTMIAFVLGNEALMAAAFGLVAGTILPPGPTIPPVVLATGLVAVVDSPWFLLTMAVEMAATAVLLRKRLPVPVFVVLLVQSAIMALSPPALEGGDGVPLAVVASSGLMIGLFVYLMEYLYRRPQLTPAFSAYLVELLGVYGLMMAGLWVWLSEGAGGLFALAVVLEMVIFLAAVLRPERLGEGLDPPWQLRPAWAFQVLAWIFVAELFMGASLDLALQGPSFLAAVPTLPLTGGAGTIAGNALTNGFWYFATVTSSTWFLAMMGLEMGALVVLKLSKTRDVENRIRLGLLVGCYAAFVVFYPSVYFGYLDPRTPPASHVAVLGWNMGLGSYPVAPALFGAILLTYAITGSLATLFGRRVVCSVLCSAPLMYQGTTIDAMKSFNRSSPVGRRYLSSRLRWMYQVSTGVTMSALVLVTGASYLDSTGRWNLSILGADPSTFLFAFSFSVLWYVMFVSIPYTGTYGCVTMGWCYTGTVMQAFHKVGFFKLKVRDRQVCRDCTTVDCARGCPVGLVDMPGHFRTRGEFRSSKCCGVGDCVEDCPYGNLYISDVRHWLREKIGRPTAPGMALRPASAERGRFGPGVAAASGPTLLPMARRGVPARAPRDAGIAGVPADRAS